MPNFKFQKLPDYEIKNLSKVGSGLVGLSAELSDDGLSYEFKDDEGNFATFSVNPETGAITQVYDPEGDNEIFEIEKDILATLHAVETSAGGRRLRRRRNRRKTARRHTRHTRRRVTRKRG
jgi:hypothetical protein